MRIIERADQRLVLAGVPGGLRWMVLLTAVGAALTTATVWAAIYELNRGNPSSLIWIGIGFLIAQAMLWAGLVTIIFARERLELDKAAARGVYTVRSPIIETDAASCRFSFAEIDSVSLERRIEQSPSSADMRSRGPQTEVYAARLRLTSPRRAIKLFESVGEPGRARARQLAETVADFLGADLADATPESPHDERRGSPAALATPIAASQMPSELDLPQQPPTNEWSVRVEPEDLRITISRVKRGGPKVFGCFLLLFTGLCAIASAMAVAAWLPGQTFNAAPIPPGVRAALTIPGLIGAIAAPWAWLSLVRGYRRVTIDPQRVRTEWIYPGRTLLKAAPGLNQIFAKGMAVPTRAVESVKTINAGDEGRVAEVRTADARIRIGSALHEESQERDSIVWLAKAIRTAIKTLGA